MICKECGAYNPDHATYCKVCAVNLKDAEALASQLREKFTEAVITVFPTRGLDSFYAERRGLIVSF